MYDLPITLPELTGGSALLAFLLGQLLLWIDGQRRTAPRFGATPLARRGRQVTAGAWVFFAAFWLAMVPTFLLVMRSAVETVLAIGAVPLCLLAARELWRGRPGVVLLTRAIGITGVIYAVAMTPAVRQLLIETVATHTEAGIHALGYDVVRQHSAVNGFDGEFVFTDAAGNRYVTYIVLACTGIGAIATFTGVILAVRAPIGRKIRAIGAVVALVWSLNVARNVFIAVAFGDQWFQTPLLISLTHSVGYRDPALASYFVADRLVSQTLSVFALLAVAALVLRLLPETKTIFEAVLYLATGRRYEIDPVAFRLARIDEK